MSASTGRTRATSASTARCCSRTDRDGVSRVFVGPTTSIAAGGLLLRVLGIGDAEAVVEATRECADAVWVPEAPPYTVEQARGFLADYERRRQAGDAVSFGVFRPYGE